jgi:hypothetical protein
VPSKAKQAKPAPREPRPRILTARKDVAPTLRQAEAAPKWSVAQKQEMDNFLNDLATEAKARPKPDLAERSMAMAREIARESGRDNHERPQEGGSATSPPSASPTSARPPSVGPPSGRPLASRHRLAGPAHRRRCARSCAPPATKNCAVPGTHRAAARPLFLGDQAGLAARRIPGARQRAERGELAFGTVDSWLVWRLTGGRRHVTDPSNASRTLLFDIHRGAGTTNCWRCSTFPARCCPRWCASSGEVGHLRPELFGAAKLPIAGIAGDQQAATFGQACLTPGMAKNTYGTGCFMLINTGEQPRPPRQHGLLTTVPGATAADRRMPSKAASSWPAPSPSGCATASGIIENAGEVEALAASVPDSGGVVWCRPSPASARRGGIPARAAPCSA